MTSPFKSLDPSRYQWIQSHEDPQIWRRRALAGENLWLQRTGEIRQLFLGANISLSPLPRDTLRTAARNAWSHLATANPHITIRPLLESSRERLGGVPERFVEFHMPTEGRSKAGSYDTSSFKLEAWVRGTIFHEPSDSVLLGFDDLRRNLMGRVRGQENMASILLHEIADKSHPDDCSQLETMLFADHLMTDGIGIRILLGSFLSLFAEELAGLGGSVISKPPAELSLSIERLAQPWCSLMNHNQVVSGEEFEAAVKAQEKFLLSDIVGHLIGLRVLTY